MDKIDPKIKVEYVEDAVVVTLLLEKILEQGDIQAMQESIMPLEHHPAQSIKTVVCRVVF